MLPELPKLGVELFLAGEKFVIVAGTLLESIVPRIIHFDKLFGSSFSVWVRVRIGKQPAYFVEDVKCRLETARLK